MSASVFIFLYLLIIAGLVFLVYQTLKGTDEEMFPNETPKKREERKLP